MNKIALFFVFYITLTTALPRQERIVGGTVTSISVHPYSAALLSFRSNGIFVQTCGGTIINNRSILTTGSCLNYKVENLRSRIASSFANSGGEVHFASQLIQHPGYGIYTLENDVGLFRVQFAFRFGPNVRAAPIVGPNAVIPANTIVTAIGWGSINPGGYGRSEQLRQVQIPTVPDYICQYNYLNMTAGHLCAGPLEGGRGSCEGDHGSPLVLNNAIVGITSFAYDCGAPNLPALYSRVAYFSNWIVGNA
ncbi:trypsin, alkaline B-like [Bicyclus anynana]|uniref:Trypsin, alkaline B-like n=1 Tax=Bicyclus anynana TaxID=110368 RepID=A0A6J1NYV9_BICAN|nr:trypsin, alkaline B-like [Bicyclus anynana]